MYMFLDMIDLGLLKDQKWPSESHKVVAQNIGLYNSLVVRRDDLTEIVQKIISIPIERIKTVTMIDLATEFDVPFIRLS